ncbi:MAG: hypothetical protein ACRETI_00930 [Steroidobacteraceae bacterium]
MAKVLEQIRNNLVAIVSLFVALSALGYSTWRNERTEQNRNVREAGFALLAEIGSLQQIVFYAHYQPGDMRGDARMGWADVLTILDLAELMPEDVGRDARALRETWQADWAGLGEDQDAHRRIDEAIDTARRTTIERMRALR